MSKINVKLPEGQTLTTGTIVSFIAPCGCTTIEGMVINGVDFAICDNNNNVIAGYDDTIDYTRKGIDFAWSEGAIIAAIIDVERHRAYLLNGGMLPLYGGDMYGEIDMKGNALVGLAGIPVQPNEAVPLSYLSSFMGYKRKIEASEDLNDLTDPGVYYYPTNGLPVNAPFNNASIILVFGEYGVKSRTIQWAFRYGGVGNGMSAYRSLYSDNTEKWAFFSTTTHTHDILDFDGSRKWTVLWRNAGLDTTSSSYSSFDEQELKLSFSGYDSVAILTSYNTAKANGAQISIWKLIDERDCTMSLQRGLVDSGNKNAIAYRKAVIPKERNVIEFGPGYLTGKVDSNGDPQSDPARAIPLIIYGIEEA